MKLSLPFSSKISISQDKAKEFSHRETKRIANMYQIEVENAKFLLSQSPLKPRLSISLHLTNQTHISDLDTKPGTQRSRGHAGSFPVAVPEGATIL